MQQASRRSRCSSDRDSVLFARCCAPSSRSRSSRADRLSCRAAHRQPRQRDHTIAGEERVSLRLDRAIGAPPRAASANACSTSRRVKVERSRVSPFAPSMLVATSSTRRASSCRTRTRCSSAGHDARRDRARPRAPATPREADRPARRTPCASASPASRPAPRAPSARRGHACARRSPRAGEKSAR